jgi:hypothetical protein
MFLLGKDVAVILVRRVRSCIFAAQFLAILLAGHGAGAETIDFNTLVSTGQNGFTAPTIGFQLTLADDFIPESFSRQCNLSCTSTGDFSDFSLLLTFNGSPEGLLNASGDPLYEFTKGTLDDTSGQLTWNTSMNTVSLNFGEGIWSATVFSDADNQACGGSTGCTASGTLSVIGVPEPATVSVFAAGLLGLASVRRKRLPKTS